MFSLLSAATTSPPGRPYVWAIVYFLISTNQISDMNFSPCRHLLMRFLFGYFNSLVSLQFYCPFISIFLFLFFRVFVQNPNTDEFPRGPFVRSIDQSAGMSMWQLSSLECLMRMTNMAVAGYIVENFSSDPNSPRRVAPSPTNFNSHSHSSFSSSALANRVSQATAAAATATTSINVKKNELMSFPLPMHSTQRHPAGGSLKTTNGSTQPSAGSGSGAAASGGKGVSGLEGIEAKVTVACIHFSRAEEIEVLWLETVKTFADLSNSLPFEVSRKSTYCLQVSSKNLYYL